MGMGRFSEGVSRGLASSNADGLMSEADYAKLALLTTTLTTDANGWQVNYEATGKRLWRKQWLAVATTAAADAAVVSAASLPVGVSTQAAVHFESVTCRLSGNAGRVGVTVEGAEATTTLTIIDSTTDAATLDSKAAAIDIFVTLAER